MSGKRVLCLNLGGLGDMITTLPLLSALGRAGCESVTSLVWPSLESFASCADCIGTAVALPKKKENGRELGLFIRELCGTEGFDLVLDFAFQPRAGIITRAAAGRRTVGFGLSYREHPWYTDIIPNRRDEHRLERNLKVLDRLGLPRPLRPEYGVTTPPDTEETIRKLFQARGIDMESERFAALHPGSGVASRNWPAERFAELADRIADESGMRIVLLGGKGHTYDGADEGKLSREVESMMMTGAVNLAGELDLPGLTALLGRCSLFIGNNSGPAHLAATVAGAPSLVVWAPRNEKVWAPARANGPVEIVLAEPGCVETCAYNQCPEIERCLGMITVEMVYARYLRRFAPAGGSRRAAGGSS